MPVVALGRGVIGNRAPWTHPLNIVQLSPLPNFAPKVANTTLTTPDVGFFETLLAPLWLWGETAQTLGDTGARVYVLLAAVILLAWYGLAQLGGWRRPPVAFVLLILVQGFGATYYLTTFRSPARVLKTPFTAFDLHTHTTYSSGLLTPQQQIDWHRARGFKGLAFTDSNRMIPEREFAGLQASNSDMLLLNGCEYRGSHHIVFLGITKAISAKEFDFEGAIQEAARQNAIVVMPHPWDDGEEKMERLLVPGVSGVEAWNGTIYSKPLVNIARTRNLFLAASTDTYSKSGSRCYTYTLLPLGMDDSDDVLRALRLKKTAVAVTSNAFVSPSAWEDSRKSVGRLKRPLAPIAATKTAWSTLTKAQQVCAVLGFGALIALVWSWGATAEKKPMSFAGPQRVVGFLRRRQLQARAPGFVLMLLAWLGSIAAAILCLSWTDRLVPGAGPVQAILAWIALDAVYLYGRSLWNRIN
jgi:hypothetical protein